MKRQTKHIKTKRIQELERLDKAVWLIPPAVCIVVFRNGIWGIIKSLQEDFVAGIVSLLLLIALLGIFYIPLMMIWRSVSRTLKKNAIEQTTFPVLEDLDYFRDELTGIDPATISMCVDYEIERDKDLTAQLLKFTMQGLIETEGTQITVTQNLNNEIVSKLSSSERFLLRELSNGNLTESVMNQWAAMAHQEVLDGPYLIKKQEKKAGKGFNGCIGCLPFFLVIIASVYFMSTECAMLVMELADKGDVSNAELIGIMSQDSRYTIGVIGITVMGIALFASMVFPFSRTIAAYLKVKKESLYTRSEQGEILAEEIYGLKNFIHDFSDLEHAQKETLVLWDDFLIYAVLLEENTSIVEEITAMRNLNIVTPEIIR